MKRQVLKKTILVSFLAVTCASYVSAYSRMEEGEKLLALNNKIQDTAQKAITSPEKARRIASKLKDILREVVTVSEVVTLANTYPSTGCTVVGFEAQYRKIRMMNHINNLVDDFVTFLV